MAGLLKRLIKKTAQKATKKVVKKATPKSTTAKRAAVRTRAKTAAKTKVNTNRKIGTKATLKGKDVYWAGKGHGWQSKTSYKKVVGPTASEKITSAVASKAKPTAKGKVTKPKYATPPPKKGDAPKGTRDSANGSKTITAKGSEAQKLKERAAAKTTKPRTNTRTRTDASNLAEDRAEGTGSRKIATAPGVKKAPGTKKSGTKTTQLTKAQRDRRTLTNKRDIGAKAAADKTPKSTSKTTSQAGGPVNKGRDVKNSTDITAKQRDGKSKTYGSAPQPKGTNPRQTPSGKKRINGEEKANKALKNFNVEKRILDMKDKFSAKNTPNLTAAERKAKIRAETKVLRTKAQGLRAQVQDKVKRQTDAARYNQSPGKSDKSNQRLGRDWRNRLSDSNAKAHSEHMTRIRSGKSVRTNGELVQSPKGRGTQQPAGGPQHTNKSSGSYKADSTTNSDLKFNRQQDVKRGAYKGTARDKSMTIRNSKGEFEAKVPPKPRQPTRTKKDTAYQPKGADPSVNAVGDSVTKTGNRSKVTGAPLNQQGPKRKPVSVDMERRANTGGEPASGPQAAMVAERKREQKAMKALRERNEKVRKADAKKESKLRSAATRSRMQIKGKD